MNRCKHEKVYIHTQKIGNMFHVEYGMCRDCGKKVNFNMMPISEYLNRGKNEILVNEGSFV